MLPVLGALGEDLGDMLLQGSHQPKKHRKSDMDDSPQEAN